jgi:single-stranded DNA-binding protein
MFSRETVVRNIGGKEVKQEVVFGVGRLTNNPPTLQEVGQDKKKVLRGNKDHLFSVALDKGKDQTEFFNLSAWEQTAENLAKLGYKGQPIAVVGRIEKNEYEGKTYETLVLERFQVLKYKDSENGTPANTPASSNDSAPTGATEVPNNQGGDDDIPF